MWQLGLFIYEFIVRIVEHIVDKFYSFGVRYPILLGYIAAVAVLSASFYVIISTILASLSLVFPTQYLTLVQPIIPSNLKSCFSVVLSVRLIVLSYNWAFKFKEKLYEMSVDSFK